MDKYITLLLGIFLCLAEGAGAAVRGHAEDGRLDLRAWDPGAEGVVGLTGTWEFHWQKLLNPGDFADPTKVKDPEYIPINKARNWNNLSDASMDGFGTYRLVVSMPPGRHRLAMNSSIFWSSSRIFANGVQIFQTGKPAAEKGGYQFGIRRYTGAFEVQGGRLEIIVQVANYDMFLLGHHGLLLLGEADALSRYLEERRAAVVLVIGGLAMMGLYHLMLSLFFRHSLTALWIGLACILAGLYCSLMDGDAIYLIFPDLTGTLAMRLVSLSWYGAALALVQYVRMLYPAHFSPRVYRLVTGLGVLMWLHVLVAPMRHYLAVAPVFQLMICLTFAYTISTAIRVIRGGDRVGLILLFTFMAMAVAVVNDMLYTTGLIQSEFLGAWALVILIMGQSLSVSLRYRAVHQAATEKKAIEHNLAVAQSMYGSSGADPASVPGVTWETYYQPADATGGDWFDVWHDEETNRLYVVVGDVSGHGMTSALMTVAASGAMNSARDALHRSATHLRDQREVLSFLAHGMNAAAHTVTKRYNLHMTMAFVSIDLTTGQACYLNAGHAPLYLVKAGKPKQMLKGGTPLGMSKAGQFGDQDFQMTPGDCLLIYTDGLIENTGPDGRRLNLRRTLNSLSHLHTPAQLQDEILRRCYDLWQGHPAEDDSVIITVGLTDHQSSAPAGRQAS